MAPQGPGNRSSMPPGPGSTATPPPAAAAPRSKRQYAANQADAYAGDASAFAAPGSQPQPGQPQQPSQFFSPGLGNEQQQQPQYFGAAAGGQQQGGPAPYMDGSRQPQQPYQQGGQQPQYGQQPQPGQVNGMTQQFGQMGLGQRPVRFPPSDLCRSSSALAQIAVQTVNLINMPLNPAELLSPPPEIKLPPNVRSR